MSRCDGIDFRNLKKRPTTIFLILPAERLTGCAVWLRLAIESALRGLYRQGGVRTVFLLDEMAVMGHLKPIEDAIGLVRGYNVQILGVFQDLPQLKDAYKQRWDSFIANAGVVASFAANDVQTAEYLSKRTGQKTARSRSESSGLSGRGGDMSWNQSESINEIARPVLYPHDFYSLEEGTGAYWFASEAGTGLFAAPDYTDLQCDRRALPDPYANG
jgi:type IV secretion system protein VirD4